MVQKVDTPLPSDKQMPHWFWQVFQRINSNTIDGIFASQALFSLGTAGAPGIAFIGDTNTGIYSPGADQISISTAGSARIAVAAAGNVTINAPSSGTALTINTTGTLSALSLSDGTITTLARYVSSQLELGNFSNHGIAFVTNSISRVLIGSGGNVTIGAPTSGTALSVSASGNDAAVADLDGNSANGKHVVLPFNLIFGSSGTGYPTIGYNAKPTNVPDWKYKVTDTATYIQFQQERFDFYSAASGTAGNTISATNTFKIETKYFKGVNVTVANLVAAGTAGAGARAFVTDATATTFASTVAGGGSNNVPVYSNGTNWLIG